MGSKPKILAFSGSIRTGSLNTKLIKLAAGVTRAAGADVTEIDLREFSMPLYDGDLQAKNGLPDTTKSLKKIFLEHHGLLISSPEYNSSVSPLLKNTLDWISRSDGSDKELAVFENKVAGLMSASPGALGGLRGLLHLRAILSNIKVLVVPAQAAVGGADAFSESGTIRDANRQKSVEQACTSLVQVTRKLIASE